MRERVAIWVAAGAVLVLGLPVAGCGAAPAGQTAAPELVVAEIPKAATPAAAPTAVASASPATDPGTEESAEDPGETRDQAEFGMIGLLNAGAGSTDGPSAPWAQDEEATGSVFGSLVGDGAGLSGIGVGTLGHGTGVRGIGVGGTGRAGPPPTMKLGTPKVTGRLPPEVIKRIVRVNVGRYRLCYEGGLRKNPSLSGELTVKLVIGRDGAVSGVSKLASTVADAEVVSCIVRSFHGLSFPQPEGGIVIVEVPLQLAPPATASAPPPVISTPAVTAAPSAAPAAPKAP